MVKFKRDNESKALNSVQNKVKTHNDHYWGLNEY